MLSLVHGHRNCVTVIPISFVILNLFQDNMRRFFVILKQVQDDESGGVSMTRGVFGRAVAVGMRPDRIILGEIRGSEATTFLRAVNTGHPGSISTIHADTPERAIDQLALLVMETGTKMGWDDVVRYVRKSLSFIVQLRRYRGARVIESVLKNA